LDRKRTASSAAGGIFRCGGGPRDAISKRRFSSSSLFAPSSRPAVRPWSRLLGAHSPLRRRCLDGSSVPSDQLPDVQPCTGRMESPGSMRSMALAFLLPRPTMIQRLSPRAPASRGRPWTTMGLSPISRARGQRSPSRAFASPEVAIYLRQ
jgi:hypothetical protein